MTPAELSEITQRADKLDKGKWKAEITYHEEPGYEQFIKRIEIVQKSTCIARMDWSNPPKEYAEFIAHARQDIPALLTHIGELTGKAGELEAIGEQMRWVPVSEKLPDNGQTVDIYMPSYIGRLTNCIFYKKRNQFYNSRHGMMKWLDIDGISHWMRRPERPAENDSP